MLSVVLGIKKKAIKKQTVSTAVEFKTIVRKRGIEEVSGYRTRMMKFSEANGRLVH